MAPARDDARVDVPELAPSSVRTERLQDVAAVTLVCRLDPAMKRRADYALVPFEVAAGTARLEVEYAYDEREGANQIDLGLVDPRGAEFSRFPGFRGWSGAVRHHVVLTEQAATPGYLPGPIEPGRWWVLLGLYKVSSEPLEVALTIRTAPSAGEVAGPRPHTTVAGKAPRPAPGRAREAPIGEPRWYRGDLHSHTSHSDAPGSLEELVGAARERGLEFLAVTDHNTTSHFPYLSGYHELALLPGEEVTSYYGHMNVWGNSKPLEFRLREASELRPVIEAAHAQGAIVSASHPTVTGVEWTFGYELPLDCLEVWHGRAGALNAVTLEMWDGMLSAGRRVTAVGGSDVHIGKPGSPVVGEPTTWIRARGLTPAALLEGLSAGRVTITAHDGPWLELQATDGTAAWGVGDSAPSARVSVRCTVERGAGCTVRVISAQQELVAAAVDADHFELELAVDLGQERLVRAELRGTGNASWQEAFPLLALTNPIWCA